MENETTWQPAPDSPTPESIQNNGTIPRLPLPYCVWTLTVSDCKEQEFFKVVYFVSTYFSLFIFLCAAWLLAWRLYSKPNIKLLSLRGFLAMEGFLFIQIIWGAFRVATCLLLVYNLFPRSWIVRELLVESTWLLGFISVVTYLAGILRTIPRMHFFRQNPHYKHSLHLPTLRGIAVVYFTYVFMMVAIVLSCAVTTGWIIDTRSGDKSSKQIINVLMAVQYSTYSVSCLLVSLGYIIYGRKLIRIVSEGLHHMEGLNEYNLQKSRRRPSRSMSGELEIKHKKLKRSVHKMKFIHFGFTSSFIGMGISLAFFAFKHDFIFENLTWSKTFSVIANWMPLLLNVGVITGIAYGEMQIPDKTAPPMHNIVTIHPDSIVIHQQRPSSTASHSRNASTDSEAPLISWPPPTAISTFNTARRFSNTLSSPSSPRSPQQPFTPLSTTSPTTHTPVQVTDPPSEMLASTSGQTISSQMPSRF